MIWLNIFQWERISRFSKKRVDFFVKTLLIQCFGSLEQYLTVFVLILSGNTAKLREKLTRQKYKQIFRQQKCLEVRTWLIFWIIIKFRLKCREKSANWRKHWVLNVKIKKQIDSLSYDAPKTPTFEPESIGIGSIRKCHHSEIWLPWNQIRGREWPHFNSEIVPNS